jgi:membrane-bound inhibitor of C-type lysozyme
MRRLSLIVVLGLTLAGCATAPSPGTDSSPLIYRCAGGRSFTAAWNQPGDRVRVSAGGVTKSLPSARSASGARYVSGGYEIWGKGDGATLSGFPGGPYASCSAG